MLGVAGELVVFLAGRDKGGVVGGNGGFEQVDGSAEGAAGGVVVSSCVFEDGEVDEGGGELGVVVAERPGPDVEAALVGGGGGVEVTVPVVDGGEVVERDRDLVVIGAEGPLEHGEDLAEEPLGLLGAVERIEDGGERGPVRGHVEVALAESGDADVQAAAAQHCRAVVVAPGMGEAGQVVPDAGQVGVVGAEVGVEGGQGLAVQRLGLVEAGEVLAADPELVAETRDDDAVAAGGAGRIGDGGLQATMGVVVVALDAVLGGGRSKDFHSGEGLVNRPGGRLGSFQGGSGGGVVAQSLVAAAHHHEAVDDRGLGTDTGGCRALELRQQPADLSERRSWLTRPQPCDRLLEPRSGRPRVLHGGGHDQPGDRTTVSL